MIPLFYVQVNSPVYKGVIQFGFSDCISGLDVKLTPAVTAPVR